MEDTVARRRYAGETSAVAVKQTAREEPEAHPEHVEGDGRAGGTTDRRFDGHSDHGGAIFNDGDAPVATMDKMVNQPGTKHHSIMAKLKACSSRVETHRRTLATVMRTRRRYCRPRGRKRRTASSWGSQVTRAGWLGAQGLGGAVYLFAETVQSLNRR